MRTILAASTVRPDSAAAQMRLLGHDFYMFLDSETDKHSVLYLRGDGNYGMIQPK